MKRGKLGNCNLKNMTSKRQDSETPTAAPTPAAPAAPTNEEPERRMTLRIREGGWLELNMLRLEQRRPVNSLITEAINDYLVKNGKPPSA